MKPKVDSTDGSNKNRVLVFTRLSIKVAKPGMTLVVFPIPELVGRGVGFDFGLFTVVELSFEDFASLYSEPAF